MTRVIRLLVAFSIVAVLAWGFAAAPAVVHSPPGTFVWHDLVTDNPAAGRAFYAGLFGWTFEAATGIDPGYTLIRAGTDPIGGIVMRRDDTGSGAQWLSYVAVDDVDKTVDAFRKGGGRVFRGPLMATPDLRVAAVADAQGAALGLASRGPKGDTDGVPAVNHWLWMDYVAHDVPSALQFYEHALGFQDEISDQRDAFTYHLLKGDRPRAGLFASPWARETSAWLPYVRVEDPVAMAARAEALGGHVLLTPSPRVRNGSLAIVIDPGGAPIALQKFPFEPGDVR